jgi:hypothetical protein
VFLTLGQQLGQRSGDARASGLLRRIEAIPAAVPLGGVPRADVPAGSL